MATYYDNAGNLFGAGSYWEYSLAGRGTVWVAVVSNLIVNQSEGSPVVLEIFGARERTLLTVSYATSEAIPVRANLLRIQPVSGSGLSVRIVVADQNPLLQIQTVQFPANTTGSGTDGSAILDGSATVAWATLTGTTYSMIRACAMVSLTINPTITLQTNGYQISATNAFLNSGTIQGGTARVPGQAAITGPCGLYSGACRRQRWSWDWGRWNRRKWTVADTDPVLYVHQFGNDHDRGHGRIPRGRRITR